MLKDALRIAFKLAASLVPQFSLFSQYSLWAHIALDNKLCYVGQIFLKYCLFLVIPYTPKNAKCYRAMMQCTTYCNSVEQLALISGTPCRRHSRAHLRGIYKTSFIRVSH